MKRYILSCSVWNKRLKEIVRMIGKARKNKTKWGGEVTRKEMRRLVISWNHYQRRNGYISEHKTIMGVAKLWEEETGEKGILDLFIIPLPPTLS